jgi:hypothetical protein
MKNTLKGNVKGQLKINKMKKLDLLIIKNH